MKTCQKALTLCGNEFRWKATDEVNPPDISMAVAKIHFGGSAGMLAGIKSLGFANLADAMGRK